MWRVDCFKPRNAKCNKYAKKPNRMSREECIEYFMSYRLGWASHKQSYLLIIFDNSTMPRTDYDLK